MTHPENNSAHVRTQVGADATKSSYSPTYRSVLQEPTVSLSGNPNDRPDVATAAILGYN